MLFGNCQFLLTVKDFFFKNINYNGVNIKILLIVLGKLFLNIYCTVFYLTYSRYISNKSKANIILK